MCLQKLSTFLVSKDRGISQLVTSVWMANNENFDFLRAKMMVLVLFRLPKTDSKSLNEKITFLIAILLS